MGHWYDKDGNPCHFQKKAKGEGTRATTLRDARKLNLFPSVTGIIDVADKPALTNWKIDQALKCSLQTPFDAALHSEENIEAWCSLVKMKANEYVDETATKGSDIHADIEDIFNGKEPYRYPSLAEKAVQAILEYTGQELDWFAAEVTFAHPDGYGGMVDLVNDGTYGEPIIIDWKTKDFNQETRKKVKAYDNHHMQLSACRHGLELPIEGTRLINVFISRESEEVEPVIVEHQGDAYDQFECLLKYWQLAKGYKPE